MFINVQSLLIITVAGPLYCTAHELIHEHLPTEQQYIATTKSIQQTKSITLLHNTKWTAYLEEEDKMNDYSDVSPEVFPLVLGSILIIATALFTLITLLTIYNRMDRSNIDNIGNKEEEETLNGRRPTVFRRNTWIKRAGDQELDEENGTPNKKVIMSWKNLSCAYSSKNGEENVTLQGVTGHIKCNELVAIMGGSGGGKSTLMDILSGRKSLGKLGGDISVLGQTMPPTSNALRNIAAYVPQNEQFFPNQTPEEAVEFVANLKLGKDTRDGVRKHRIDQILDLVGIPKRARNRAIGGRLAGGVVLRGLSGGERKRLALACAVAQKPSILFLDEITSGLDSENAVIVIDLIKKLCVNLGVAAVVVIHQPSFQVFSQFDRLIMLSKGKCVYSDETSNIPSFYEDIGREMPQEYLVSDDLLNVTTTDGFNPSSYKESNELVATCGEKLLREMKERKKPSALLQLKTVLVRQMMNHYVRNWTNLLARVLIYGLTGLLFGCIFFNIGDTEDGQPLSFDQAKATFGAGIFLTQVYYLLPFASISTFFFDKALFAAESSIDLYPAWIYSLCQIVLEFWVISLCALVQTGVAIPMMGLWNVSITNAACYMYMYTVFCISGVVGNGLVLLTSIIAFSQDLAFLESSRSIFIYGYVGAANVILFLATSGGFVPFPYIEDWIVWLQWISPIKYSFQAFTWALLSNTPTTALLHDFDLDTPASVSTNIIILIGIFVFCVIGSMLALSRQKEVR